MIRFPCYTDVAVLTPGRARSTAFRVKGAGLRPCDTAWCLRPSRLQSTLEFTAFNRYDFVYKLITNIADAGNTMVQAPKLSFPKEPSPTLPLLTVAFLFHLDALLLFIIKTQLLKWFNLPNGKYSEVVHAIIPIPYDGVDCHVGITRVIEEAGHITVPHGVDAEFTGSGSGGAHVFIFAEKV